MKKTKSILTFLSLSLALSCVTAVPVCAEDTLTLPEGFQFSDIAHNGNTYVAMAKKGGTAAPRMYSSQDGGITWTGPVSLSSNTAEISANKMSQQQLVYWADKGIFVAHDPAGTYTSSDGTVWEANANLKWSSNGMITVSGENFIMGAAGKIAAVNDTDTALNSNIYDFNTTANYYTKAIGAKPVNDGKIEVMIAGSGYLNSAVYDVSQKSWSAESYAQTKSPYSPIDMAYAKGADQFIAIGDNGIMYAINSITSFVTLGTEADNTVTSSFDGVKVTGMGVSDKYIMAGLEDGSIFYTDNAPITKDTIWTEIENAKGTTPVSEPVRAIEFADNGENFVVLTSTGIYTGNTTGYKDIDEYVELSTPELAGETSNVFEGVRLIGGTYSLTLNKYIVYGDTTSPDEEGKYWGKIFISDDALSWKQVWQSYTFTKRNDNGGFAEVRNGAVWWENEGKFLISASTMDHTGIVLTSENGEEWKATTATAAEDGDNTDFRTNVDLRVYGDKLYATNAQRSVYVYYSWGPREAKWDALCLNGASNPPQDYANQIAVGGDTENPTILIAQNARGAVRDASKETDTESERWTLVSALGGAGALTDSVYSDKLGKFVAVLTGGFRTSIVDSQANVVQGPVVPGGVVCNAIDTNGEVFMFASKDGNVYTAPDTAEFSSTTELTAVPAAADTDNPNTMNVNNVFTAGDKFIATASDNVNSNVLVISKGETGYEYELIGEKTKKAELTPGSTANIRIAGTNKTQEAFPFTILAAVYDGDKLVQTEIIDTAMPSGEGQIVTEEITLNDDIPVGAVMRVFVWESADSMKPLTSSANFN